MRIRRTDGRRISLKLTPDRAKRLGEALLSGVAFLETDSGTACAMVNEEIKGSIIR